MDNVTKLREYKELLDQGVITPEQFDALKKEILNNMESTPAAQAETPSVRQSSINLNPNDPEPAISRIKLFLEEGKWNDALQYCDAATDLFPTNPTLYMLKYCAQHSISGTEELDSQPFENLAKDSVYKSAVRFSGDDPGDAKAVYEKALQKDHQKIIDSVENDNTSSLKTAISQLQSLSEAARADFDIQFIDDSLSKTKAQLSTIAINLYNENKLESLKEAKELFDYLDLSVQSDLAESAIVYLNAENAREAQDYNKALSLYKKAGDYKDAKQKIELCEQKKKVTAEKKKKKFKKILAITIAVILVTCAVFFFGSGIVSINATYSGGTEKGTVLDESNTGITVNATNRFGSVKEVTGWTVKAPATLEDDSSSEVRISYKGKECDLKVDCTSSAVVSIDAKYEGDTEYDVVLDEYNTGIIVTATHKNGETDTVTDFRIESPETLKTGETSEVTIEYDGATCNLMVECTTIRVFDSKGRFACKNGALWEQAAKGIPLTFKVESNNIGKYYDAYDETTETGVSISTLPMAVGSLDPTEEPKPINEKDDPECVEVNISTCGSDTREAFWEAMDLMQTVYKNLGLSFNRARIAEELSDSSSYEFEEKRKGNPIESRIENNTYGDTRVVLEAYINPTD